MSDIVFKKYQEGFEEFQAQIYNSNALKYHGQPVTADTIKKRLHEHQPEQDKQGITYAFDGEKPLAYIQYREYAQGKVRIGFPWAVEGTPLEIQDKLFYDLLNYLKQKYPDKKEFYLGNVNHVYTDIHNMIKDHYGFQVDSWFAFYTLSLNTLLNNRLPSDFSFNEVGKESLDLITEICLRDDSLVEMGPAGIEKFFNVRIFSNDNPIDSTVVILSKNNQPIATVAVTKMNLNNKNYSTVRIVGLSTGEETAYEFLLIALAKVLESKNVLNDVSVIVDNTTPAQENLLKSIGASFLSKAFEYKLIIK